MASTPRMSIYPGRSREPPLTVQVLRAEVTGVVKQELRRGLSEALRQQKEEIQSDISDLMKEQFEENSNFLMGQIRMLMAESILRGGQSGGMEDKIGGGQSDESLGCGVQHQASRIAVNAVKTATDWVTRRRVNPFYTRNKRGFSPMDFMKRFGSKTEEMPLELRYSMRYSWHQPSSDISDQGSALDGYTAMAPRRASLLPISEGRGSVGADASDPEASSKFMSGIHSRDLSRASQGSVSRRDLMMGMGDESRVPNLQDGDAAMLLQQRIHHQRAKRTGCRGKVQNLVFTPYFEYLSCALVLINAIVVGLRTDAAARHQDISHSLSNIDQVVNWLFVGEIALRITATGSKFFTAHGKFMNMFDLLVASLTVIDWGIEVFGGDAASGSSTVSLLRNFGMIRFVRILRLTRVLVFVGELRTLVVSIGSSLQSLFWVIILLMMLTYSFGVVLTQVVVNTTMGEELDHEARDELDRLFGSVPNSMLSLFEAMSEGIHWGDVMNPLVEYCSPWLKPIFLCYIVFAMFAILNVVTGLFVEAAIETAAEDKKTTIMQQMCQMFLDLDDDGSGTISKDEFMKHLQKPEMETYLRELDIDTQEGDMLFHLLDLDGSGEIEAEELVGGCLRLHGHAKALELAALMHELRQFSRRFQVHAHHVEGALSLMTSNRGLRSSTYPKNSNLEVTSNSGELSNAPSERHGPTNSSEPLTEAALAKHTPMRPRLPVLEGRASRTVRTDPGGAHSRGQSPAGWSSDMDSI